jgi:hypothetical protein
MVCVVLKIYICKFLTCKFNMTEESGRFRRRDTMNTQPLATRDPLAALRAKKKMEVSGLSTSSTTATTTPSTSGIIIRLLLIDFI